MIRPGFWKTFDGREIPIAALQNNHLKNILAMLRRAANRHPRIHADRLIALGSPPNGDMASYYWEQELMDAGQAPPTVEEITDLYPVYRELLDEWNLRKKMKVV